MVKRTALQRKTPMRRAIPKPYVRPERERTLSRLYRVPAPFVPTECEPIPKREWVRSPLLILAYRLLPCQWEGCGIEDGTVCAAHSNWRVHGKFKAIKADDNRCASLCVRHHSALDQGSILSEDERKTGWWRAHCRTVVGLQAIGKWPGRVPVPDISAPPTEWETA